MPRVNLDLPDKYIFSTEVNVRIADINYGGHLGNDAILSLIHEARVRFLNNFGFTEFNIDGVGLIMVDAVVIYKAESFYGDVLKIDVTVDDVNKTGCDFIYRISNKKTQKEIARAKTGIVFYDYAARKVAMVPAKFREIFKRNQK